MGCNAWNHSFGCDCGWGGNTGGGRVVFRAEPTRSTYARDWSYARAKVTYESYVNPNAKCPVCGAGVFFYQSPYGGRVFFDALGGHWPKHPCTDSSATSGRDPPRWQGPPAPGVGAFVEVGWEPIFEARWRPWTSASYTPGVLTGLVGRARRPLSVTFPFGTALHLHAPLLAKPHAVNANWTWIDAPFFSEPVLSCSADPRFFRNRDLEELARELGHCDTLVKLADMCSFEVEDVPGRANYRQARLWLEDAARRGDRRAHNNLGVIYECGLGVPADLTQALTHYRHAAAQGEPVAARNADRLKYGERLRPDPLGRARHLARAKPPTRPIGVTG